MKKLRFLLLDANFRGGSVSIGRSAVSKRRFEVSGFTDCTRRRDLVAQAIARNELVAALADALFVPYAAPGGKAESAARHALARGQAVFTFADPENAHLLDMGAKSFDDFDMTRYSRQCKILGVMSKGTYQK